ncbi:Der GTPase-activating protein YihI [Vibrio porteresiae DSM 19223]|uniref:Der GTPase-activating protein YihI n=1 Tax=Vibrio porteresiae DSM 19223 TaxID=1123496 RepID=A0ABZ0QDT7_9VIBR|nr:Der GTPase-activating protein YihI [Vibrio porteresiae]WPC74040.1 Der GTPase-activating protein YihI [Vibrio porteresiae DSM 19223]
MSRSKKSRKPGSNGAADVIVVRNRSEADVEGRLRKKQKKHKGLKSGSRHSVAQEHATKTSAHAKDPRVGSKKLIPLVVEAKKKPSKQERRVSAEQELEMLENDAQLNVLLDRIDNGEKLGAGLQKYVDEKLDRIEVLMKQLGLYDEVLEDDDEEEEFDDEPVVVPTSKAKSRRSYSDEELLAQFEDTDLDEYKD